MIVFYNDRDLNINDMFVNIRKQHEIDTIDRIDGVQEKLSVAMATLQQALGGMKAQLDTQQEKVNISVIITLVILLIMFK